MDAASSDDVDDDDDDDDNDKGDALCVADSNRS